jgi:hypothetical protein
MLVALDETNFGLTKTKTKAKTKTKKKFSITNLKLAKSVAPLAANEM